MAPELTLPVGTQVVTRAAVRDAGGGPALPAGAVGVVVGLPDDDGSVRVRFPDGVEFAVARAELAVRKRVQEAGLRRPDGADLHDFVIYRCVVGSRAYGLDEEGSDFDRRGIYLPPAERHWSLWGVPEQLEDAATQDTYWELQKFLTLALKANPNVLECLYTPLLEKATPLAEELLGMREIYLSRLVYQTYNGYVLSQFRKLEQDLRTRGAIKWKHAMHLVRLLLAGVTVLEERYVPVRVREERERLLAIRRGAVPWEEVNAWRLDLHRRFDAAYAATRLPDLPDYDRANAFLVRARRSAVQGGHRQTAGATKVTKIAKIAKDANTTSSGGARG
jgi:hypothetical protein